YLSFFRPAPLGQRAGSEYRVAWPAGQLHPADFTHVCEPGVTVEGRAAIEGGEPATGVRGDANTGSANHSDTRTDNNGSFRLTGIKRNMRINLLFEPGDESNLLTHRMTIPARSAAPFPAVDIALKRAIIVTGRVIDRSIPAGSGPAQIWVSALSDNEYIKRG